MDDKQPVKPAAKATADVCPTPDAKMVKRLKESAAPESSYTGHLFDKVGKNGRPACSACDYEQPAPVAG